MQQESAMKDNISAYAAFIVLALCITALFA